MRPDLLRFAAAVLAGMFACGVPLWPLRYSDVSMGENPSPATWLLLGALAGAFAGHLIRPGVRRPAFAIAAGFALAVMLRVMAETAADPTRHNLWPFEIVIAGFFGIVSGLAGVGVVRGVQRLTAAH